MGDGHQRRRLSSFPLNGELEHGVLHCIFLIFITKSTPLFQLTMRGGMLLEG